VIYNEHINNLNTQSKERLIYKKGMTELIVPHHENELVFKHPHYGPAKSTDLAELIEEDNLKLPSMDQTVSLAFEANRSKNKYGLRVKKSFNKQHIINYTHLLFIQNGIFIEDKTSLDKLYN
jgi:hypothetical protein